VKWKPAVKTDDGLFRIPKRWLRIHYYEALTILFRFENSLRVFVYSVLKNEAQGKWTDTSFPTNDGKSYSVKGIAAKRINQADNFGYLGLGITAPLMHLTSGELVELITSGAHWTKFKPYFKGNKEIIKNKLLEIGSIRNSLAHFRPIKVEDLELVKQNSRHTLLAVEECLTNLFSQNKQVPTNTKSDWYISISALGSDKLPITLYYSADERWTNVKLMFFSPILRKDQIDDTLYSFTLVKLNTPKILNERKNLSKYVTYISERLGAASFSDSFDIQVMKGVSLVFRSDVLQGNYEGIAEDLKCLLAVIDEESEILLKDHLARGSVLEPANGISYWQQSKEKEGAWKHKYSSLTQKYEPQHPDEYWGDIIASLDVVGGITRYPWMPEDISETESFEDLIS